MGTAFNSNKGFETISILPDILKLRLGPNIMETTIEPVPEASTDTGED